MTFVTFDNTASSLDWRQADADVFVATAAGEYAGFVAVTPQAFEAHSARGERLGIHTTRERAQEAVSASFAPTPAITRSTRAARRTPPARARRASHVRTVHVGTALPVAFAAHKEKGKTRWPLAP